MAYHSTSGIANNTADFFSRFRSFIVNTVGWTVLQEDLGAANPFLYLSSSGENGRETVYLLFDKFTANADKICVRQALWWNSGTSSAVQPAGSTGYNYVATKDSTTFPYWIFADLDHIVFVTRIGTIYNAYYFGTVKRYWSSNMALTQADVGAGSNVVVPVDDALYLAKTSSARFRGGRAGVYRGFEQSTGLGDAEMLAFCLLKCEESGISDAAKAWRDGRRMSSAITMIL